MVSAGIIEESAYYESLHETPLIANTIARKKLYEMNVVISDTAEYGCYLFDQAARPLLKAFVSSLGKEVMGEGMGSSIAVDNRRLIDVNAAIRSHSVEIVGARLRGYMTGMKAITSPQ
jgi:ketol-acid reductoisomerase